MRRLTVWILSTAAGLVLLFSYSTSTSGPAGGKAVAGVAPVGVVPVPPGPPSRPTAGLSTLPVRTKALAIRTINGAVVKTAYGPVQVQVKVQGSRITAANAIVYPADQQRSQEINRWAVPRLDDEVMRSQSAQIDTVSGASYTSDGYRKSLQSALDAAHR